MLAPTPPTTPAETSRGARTVLRDLCTTVALCYVITLALLALHTHFSGPRTRCTDAGQEHRYGADGGTGMAPVDVLKVTTVFSLGAFAATELCLLLARRARGPADAERGDTQFDSGKQRTDADAGEKSKYLWPPAGALEEMPFERGIPMAELPKIILRSQAALIYHFVILGALSNSNYNFNTLRPPNVHSMLTSQTENGGKSSAGVVESQWDFRLIATKRTDDVGMKGTCEGQDRYSRSCISAYHNISQET
ncbi:hypothetical protein DFH07DRAFT_766328 [Mycena maculata]|uniref:Uncharacterized protein n=1 Tax=Mycena maculata TaxID=230809 RepID=A0AAD7K5K0_9AGAR|nr:hypothetical protein DFH07DRAFT_766328 [Mycena maculata]